MSTFKFRCQHCGGVIGVYEPLVALFDGRARTTSRLAEPEIGATASEHYHRACYAQISGGQLPGDAPRST